MKLVPTPVVVHSLEALATRPELAGRVALVTDSGLVAAGHAARAAALAGDVCVTWDACATDPTSADIDACVAALRAAQPIDAILAVGGGSVIDTAKAANLLLSHPGRSILDFRGRTAARSHGHVVAVVTTAGTGTESQCSALVTDPSDHSKIACLAPGLAVAVAVLDPELTLTQPPHVTAACGLDALTHTLETAVTLARSPASDALSRRGFVKAWSALPVVWEHPEDLERRRELLEAAHDAGAAIAHSMLGAAHATGNAWTACHGVTHGFAVARMLPAVMRFNAALPEVLAVYDGLARDVALADAGALVDALEALLDDLAPPLPRGADIDALVDAAEPQWTGTFNPRPLDREALRALFEAALGSREAQA